MTGQEIADLAGGAFIAAIVVFIFYRHLFYKENRWQLKVMALQLVVGLAAGYAVLWLFGDMIDSAVDIIFAYFGA